VRAAKTCFASVIKRDAESVSLIVRRQAIPHMRNRILIGGFPDSCNRSTLIGGTAFPFFVTAHPSFDDTLVHFDGRCPQCIYCH
jgi:hypothetical protein